MCSGPEILGVQRVLQAFYMPLSAIRVRFVIDFIDFVGISLGLQPPPEKMVGLDLGGLTTF